MRDRLSLLLLTVAWGAGALVSAYTLVVDPPILPFQRFCLLVVALGLGSVSIVTGAGLFRR